MTDSILPTSPAGFCPQPHRLVGRFPPCVRARQRWRVAPGFPQQAQDNARDAADGRMRAMMDGAAIVRRGIRDFAVRYNAGWLIGKNGYHSPLDARAAWLDTNLRRAA